MVFTTGMFGVVGGGNGGLKNVVVEHNGPFPVRLEVVPVEVDDAPDLMLVGRAL